MKKMFLLLFFVGQIVVAQQRYLISPRQEVIPLTKTRDASHILSKKFHKSVTSTTTLPCGNQFTFGYTEDKFPPSIDHIAHHKDVMGQWYIAKATGTIDSIFWDAGPDTSILVGNTLWNQLSIRIHQSVIGPTYGPGVRPGPFDPPCQNWGYWINTGDQDQGVAAFPEDANPYPGAFHSTIAHGTAGPPFGNGIWGFGGYKVIDHGNTINSLAMLADGFPCSVSVGQVFFINIRVVAPPQHVVEGPTDGFTWLTWTSKVSAADENYPSRNWKFYEHDSGPANCAGVPVDDVKRGWVARGGFTVDDTLQVAALNWWYTMTVTSNTPPEVSDNDIPHNTLSTGPQHVEVAIDDCDPANPPLAGVASASLNWALDGIVQGSSNNGFGDW